MNNCIKEQKNRKHCVYFHKNSAKYSMVKSIRV